MKTFAFAVTAAILSSFAVTAHAAQGAEDELAFTVSCAACHADTAAAAGTPNERAPTRAVLRSFAPEAVLNALTNGKMQVQGAVLSEAQRRLISEYVTGKRLGVDSVNAVQLVNACTIVLPLRNPDRGPSWNGHGNGLAATRYQPAAAGKLTAADLPHLKLKWAFGYANVSAARAQPSLAGGRLFVASENGEVQALNPKTGCAYWVFKAQAGVRTALSIAGYKTADGKKGNAVYFGDGRANAYAVDAQTGKQIWVQKVDQHRFAAITGAPIVYGGRVFVGVQGLGEEGTGTTRGYSCCTFRGNINALDAATGKLLWKTYTIDEPGLRLKTRDGVQMYGPAGGSIWSAPSVDVKRGLVYVATGNAYADPAQKMTNAVIALNQQTGDIAWYRQILVADNWAMGCPAKGADNPGCPETLGPDFDFSATPMIAHVGNRDLLVLPQKSAVAYALDPDRKGAIVWQHRFGQGSGLGGQWGGTVDGSNAYFGLADFLTDKPGGMHAVRLSDGQPVWSMPPQPLLCGTKGPGCGPGQGGALTSIPGAVLNSALDGGIRAYSTKDGTILWVFDANREFETVNGVKAKGGSMDGPGPVVADGMLYVNSGYGGLVGKPGNVLLAFGLN
jgi:polyvinyl alcohol dehydrogenase (cytochrome)